MTSHPLTHPGPLDYDRLRRDVLQPGAPGGREAAFALIARARGLVSEERIRECIQERNRLQESDRRVPLGDLLLMRGHLTVTQYLDVIGMEEDLLRVASERPPQ